MFSNINSQGFTPRFHSARDVPMGVIDNLHKHVIDMLQHVIKYCKNMYVVLLEMLGLKLVNQQVEQERTHVQNYLEHAKILIQKLKQDVLEWDKLMIGMH